MIFSRENIGAQLTTNKHEGMLTYFGTAYRGHNIPADIHVVVQFLVYFPL